MNENHTRQDWYKTHRRKVETIFQKGKYLHDKKKIYPSETGKYKIEILPVVFRHGDRYFAYTLAKIKKGNKVIANIKRNGEKFPFLFVEDHIDGHDYLLCAEDYQSQTIFRLDTGDRTEFVSEKAKREMEFSWQRFHLSPDGETLAIEGSVKTKHKELAEYRECRFFSFKDPMILPYYEKGDRITCPYEDIIGWEDRDNLLVAIHEERRKTDMKPLSDMTKGRRIKCLKANAFGIRRIVYKFPLEEGDRQEVYSEWVVN